MFRTYRVLVVPGFAALSMLLAACSVTGPEKTESPGPAEDTPPQGVTGVMVSVLNNTGRTVAVRATENPGGTQRSGYPQRRPGDDGYFGFVVDNAKVASVTVSFRDHDSDTDYLCPPVAIPGGDQQDLDIAAELVEAEGSPVCRLLAD